MTMRPQDEQTASRPPNDHSERDVRRELERKVLVLNLVNLLALVFIFAIVFAILVLPSVGNDRLAALALAVAMVAFLVPTSESQRRNAIEAADALDQLEAPSDGAIWLRIERRVPRLMPRLWPKEDERGIGVKERDR